MSEICKSWALYRQRTVFCTAKRSGLTFYRARLAVVAPQFGESGSNAAIKHIVGFGFADAGGLLQPTHGNQREHEQ